MSKNYIELPTMPEWAMNQRVENTVQSYACAVIEPYIETLFKIGEHLGIDYQAARTAPGKPSDVYIAAIKADRQRRCEPVAWHTEDHLTDKSATTYDPVVAKRWIEKGWPVTPLFYAPQPAAPKFGEE